MQAKYILLYLESSHCRNNPSIKLNLDIQFEELLRISKNILKDVWSYNLEREIETLVSFPFSVLLATISPFATHLYPVSKIEESSNYGPVSLTHSSISNGIGNIFSYTGLRIKSLNLYFFFNFHPPVLIDHVLQLLVILILLKLRVGT